MVTDYHARGANKAVASLIDATTERVGREWKGHGLSGLVRHAYESATARLAGEKGSSRYGLDVARIDHEKLAHLKLPGYDSINLFHIAMGDDPERVASGEAPRWWRHEDRLDALKQAREEVYRSANAETRAFVDEFLTDFLDRYNDQMTQRRERAGKRWERRGFDETFGLDERVVAAIPSDYLDAAPRTPMPRWRQALATGLALGATMLGGITNTADAGTIKRVDYEISKRNGEVVSTFRHEGGTLYEQRDGRWVRDADQKLHLERGQCFTVSDMEVSDDLRGRTLDWEYDNRLFSLDERICFTESGQDTLVAMAERPGQDPDAAIPVDFVVREPTRTPKEKIVPPTPKPSTPEPRTPAPLERRIERAGRTTISVGGGSATSEITFTPPVGVDGKSCTYDLSGGATLAEILYEGVRDRFAISYAGSSLDGDRDIAGLPAGAMGLESSTIAIDYRHLFGDGRGTDWFVGGEYASTSLDFAIRQPFRDEAQSVSRWDASVIGGLHFGSEGYTGSYADLGVSFGQLESEANKLLAIDDLFGTWGVYDKDTWSISTAGIDLDFRAQLSERASLLGGLGWKMGLSDADYNQLDARVRLDIEAYRGPNGSSLILSPGVRVMSSDFSANETGEPGFERNDTAFTFSVGYRW